MNSVKDNLLSNKKIIKGIVRYVSGDNVLFTRGSHLCVTSDCGANIRLFPSLPMPRSLRLLNVSRIARRLLRSDVSSWQVLSSARHVVMAKDAIYLCNDDGIWEPSTSIVGHKPLYLMLTPKNHLFYGEYRNNAERSPVSVWQSLDSGTTWRPAWTFNNIRHIHGVFYDPYTKSIWVTTGDADTESGIWVTYDEFVHLDLVAGGAQRFRVIQLLFTSQFIYFGSDDLIEENHIYRMERKTGKIDTLQAVSGTVFWGCKVGDNLFFSTAVEPSTVNKNNYACLWGSPDGEKWKCIAKFRKDIWPLKLFQYGQILFPAGDNQTGKLWFTPWATEGDQTIQCVDVTQIDWN